MRVSRLDHRFVTSAPDTLDTGILYVSLEYNTVLHLCCCGCGSEVVTALSPARWQMTYDGRAVSLWPSIGNWSLPCQSHYVIRRGEVIKCPSWSDEEIAAGRRRDHYLRAAVDTPTHTMIETAGRPPHGRVRRRLSTLWQRLLRTDI